MASRSTEGRGVVFGVFMFFFSSALERHGHPLRPQFKRNSGRNARVRLTWSGRLINLLNFNELRIRCRRDRALGAADVPPSGTSEAPDLPVALRTVRG